MVRSAAAVRVLRRVPAAESALVTERTLRRLMDENRRLRRELRELRKLERGTHQDPLTGLPNRRLFQERLREELARAARDPRLVGSILVVGLCGFDAVEDRIGSAAGDEALREMARVLRDGQPAADVCCRTAGDELMILLPESDPGAARAVLQRLRAAMFRLGARQDRAIAISAGAATWPADGSSVLRLMDVAEAAMRGEQRRLRVRGRKPPAGRRGPTLALVKR